MSRISLSLSLLLLAVLFSGFASADIGFRQLRLNESSSRPLEVTLWYPTRDDGRPQQVGENIAFNGIPALLNAQPTASAHPLLLVSHGYGGNWRNLSWLASSMAAQGYIVAAVDHPGTTTRNKEPKAAQQLWQRPRDLTQLLDYLLRSPALAGTVDAQRIAAVGHSLGGWTVMELAGARFSTARFLEDCQSHAALGGCRLTPVLGIDKPQADAPLAADLHDGRIKAVISLDLGLARGFTPQSLAQIGLPVLVMSAQADSDDVSARLESGYLFAGLPDGAKKHLSVTGATHFSFMQTCKPGAEALIEAEDPGEGIVCRDGGSLSRAEIHRHLLRDIIPFLAEALDYPPQPGGNP